MHLRERALYQANIEQNYFLENKGDVCDHDLIMIGSWHDYDQILIKIIKRALLAISILFKRSSKLLGRYIVNKKHTNDTMHHHATIRLSCKTYPTAISAHRLLRTSQTRSSKQPQDAQSA